MVPDPKIFFPRERKPNKNRPILLYVGDITHESNLQTFLDINTLRIELKRIIGTGIQEDEFKHKYPFVEFIPPMSDFELAKAIADADVLIFPSLQTNTSPLPIHQAIACQTPIAAYLTPVTAELIDNKTNGFCCKSLEEAIEKALTIQN